LKAETQDEHSPCVNFILEIIQKKPACSLLGCSLLRYLPSTLAEDWSMTS
jgi:hypothetical protein